MEDTSGDGNRVRRKGSAEFEPEGEGRAAKKRKQSNDSPEGETRIELPASAEQQLQAALEAARQVTAASNSNIWSSTDPSPLPLPLPLPEQSQPTTNSNSNPNPVPNSTEKWETRAAGVRDSITSLLGGDAWLTQQISDIGHIQIRGNGGLCAVKNCIRAAFEIPGIKEAPKNGRLPLVLEEELIREFKTTRESAKGKSYNNWFLSNFAKGDFERVTKIFKGRADEIAALTAEQGFTNQEGSNYATYNPYAEEEDGSPLPTVRRLDPYYVHPEASANDVNESHENGVDHENGHEVTYATNGEDPTYAPEGQEANYPQEGQAHPDYAPEGQDPNYDPEGQEGNYGPEGQEARYDEEGHEVPYPQDEGQYDPEQAGYDEEQQYAQEGGYVQEGVVYANEDYQQEGQEVYQGQEGELVYAEHENGSGELQVEAAEVDVGQHLEQLAHAALIGQEEAIDAEGEDEV